MNPRLKPAAPTGGVVLQRTGAGTFSGESPGGLSVLALNSHTSTELPEVDAAQQALCKHARQILAVCNVPERILVVTRLPKVLTGKIQRRAVKGMVSAGSSLVEQSG